MDLHNFEAREVGEMIADAGFTLETHKNIETHDGYFLTMHRIPHPKNGNFLNVERRQPVLLLHGMLGCSGHFLMHGDSSLPYLLAEAGFDVWMGNVRGVIYSREHRTLNYAKDVAYWHFSMHEMGVYDIPAMIDHILNTTNSEKVHYIGYSQGCVAFFIMCSERPEYAEKISLSVGLSPLIYVKGAVHPWLPILAKFEKPLQLFTRITKFCGFRFGFLRRYEHLITSHSWVQSLIKTLIFGTFGTKQDKIKNETIPITMRFFQGLNCHCLYHAMQIFNKGKFVQYDNGAKKNKELYGTETVREYKVENATCPVILYYTNQDWFMPAKNALLLGQKLPNLIAARKVESEDFSHFDFLIAEEAVEKVYKPVVKSFMDFHSDQV